MAGTGRVVGSGFVAVWQARQVPFWCGRQGAARLGEVRYGRHGESRRGTFR